MEDDKSKLSSSSSSSDVPSSSFLSTRHFILALAVLCISAAKSNDLTFTFTVICMTGNASVNAPTVSLSPNDISIAFAGAGAGALVTAMIIALLLQALGGRIVFACLLVLSGTATMIIPLSAPLGLMAFFPLRVVQGIAVAGVMPMIGYISARWAPLSEMGHFVTTLTAGMQLAQIITMPLSGELCVTAGWQWAYYVHGLFSITIAIVFVLFFRNSPDKHPHVRMEELRLIKAGGAGRLRKAAVPYSRMFKSPPIWAISVAFLGNTFGYQLILQYMPTFLNKVLQVPISRTGLSAIIPPVMQIIVKMIGGYLSDHISCISERHKLQMFNSIAMIGCGAFLVPLGFIHPGSSIIAILLFTASISCIGLITSGSIKSVALVSRHFSHVVMAVVQVVVCIGYLTVPMVVSTLAPDNTLSQWRFVFITAFIILLSTNLFFCYFCDSEPAEWTKDKDQTDDALVVKDSQTTTERSCST